MYQPILGVLGYILSQDRTSVLMVHRNKRKEDDHYGKYNGLGGKVERGEDVLSALKREIREEAGIECVQVEMRGTINWTGFGKKNEDWFGFIFLITKFTGEPLKENHEGTLEWVELEHLNKLPQWEGDKYFLPLIFDHDKRPFYGFMPYQDGRPLHWEYLR